MSIEDDLRQHFKSDQPTAPSTGLGPEAIMRIGQEHRKTSRIRSTAAGFVVVSAAVLVVLTLPNTGADRTTDPVAIEAPSTTTILRGDAGPGDAPSRVAVETRVVESAGLTWTITEPTLGWARRMVADSTGFYALSTAPGTTWEDASEANGYRIPESLYYSADGINWTVRDLPDDQYVADFGASNGTLYLLGTSAATSDPAGPVETWLATSSDLGETWDRQTLPDDTHPAPVGLGDYVYGNTAASLAVHDSTALASVRTNYWVDVYQLAPAKYRDGNFDIRQTESGIDVFDLSGVQALERACDDAWYHYELDTPPADRVPDFIPEACQNLEGAWAEPTNIVFTATWEELGVADVGPLSYSDLYMSVDRGALVALESPFPETTESMQLSGDAAGFWATAWGTSDSSQDWTSSLWTSADGLSWTEVTPSGTYEATPIGTFRDQLIAITYGEHGSTLLALQNGNWDEVNVDAALGPLPENSERWIGQGGAGAMGLWLTSQTTTYSNGAGDLETTTTLNPTDSYYEGGQTSFDLLFSEDLVHWSVIDLNDFMGSVATGGNMWLNQIAVSDTAIYFTVNGYNQDSNETYAAAVVGRR